MGGFDGNGTTNVFVSFSDNRDVTLFLFRATNHGNQHGDYEGLVSFAGISQVIWTDSRYQQNFASSCRTNVAMEEVFTAVR